MLESMPTGVLAVDPGLRHVGAALFRNNVLVYAARIDSYCTEGPADIAACRSMAMAVLDWLPVPVDAIGTFVAEWPRSYRPTKQKGDQNDLLALVGVGAAIASRLPRATCVTYRPEEWKGQVKKAAMNAQVWKRLTKEEQACCMRLPKGGLDHNMLDGIGLGLKQLDRLEPHRVIP